MLSGSHELSRQPLAKADVKGFAQWAGIERARYGRIERGEMNLTIDKLLELAAHLDIEPSRLLQDVTIYDCMGVQSDDEVD